MPRPYGELFILPNPMRYSHCFCWCALGLKHVKFDVWPTIALSYTAARRTVNCRFAEVFFVCLFVCLFSWDGGGSLHPPPPESLLADYRCSFTYRFPNWSWIYANKLATGSNNLISEDISKLADNCSYSKLPTVSYTLIDKRKRYMKRKLKTSFVDISSIWTSQYSSSVPWFWFDFSRMRGLEVGSFQAMLRNTPAKQIEPLTAPLQSVLVSSWHGHASGQSRKTSHRKQSQNSLIKWS